MAKINSKRKKKWMFIITLVLTLFISLYSVFAITETAWYKFEGNLTDESTNKNNLKGATGHSTFAYIPGKMGQAANMSETNYLVNLTPKGIATGNANLSMAFWIYRDPNHSGVNDIIQLGNVTGTRQLFAFRYDTNEYGTGGYTIANYADNKAIKTALFSQVWHHIVVTQNSNHSYNLYIDGVASGSNVSSGDFNIQNNVILINDIADNAQGIGGAYDDVRIYNYSLTQSEIDFLYNSGSGTTASLSTYGVTPDLYTYLSSTTVDGTTLNLTETISINTNMTNLTSLNYSEIRVYYNNGTLITTNISTSDITMFNYTPTSIGYYKFNATAYLNNGSIINLNTRTIRIFSSELNITATNMTGGTITTFNITLTNLNTSTITNHATTTGSILIDTLIGNNYKILYNTTGYAYNIQYKNMTATLNNLTTTLYPEVSIIVNLFDETLMTRIYENITITLTDITTPSIYTQSITNSNTTFLGLTAGDTYEVKFTSANYTTNRYYRIIPLKEYELLNAYLIKNTISNNVSMCFFNTNGESITSNLHVFEYVLTNTSYVLVQDQYTDLNGRTIFSFNPTKYYYYTWDSTTYAISSFILNPPQNTLVLSSGCNYDITLQYAASAITYDKINVTGSHTYSNITKIITTNYESTDPTITNYSYTVSKIIDSAYTVLCSGSSTSTTNTYTCDTTGYDGMVYIQQLADGQIFYGSWQELSGPQKLFDNIEPKDGAYWAGWIVLVITFMGIFFGIVGTLVMGLAGLTIVYYLGILTPLTATMIIADMVIVGVIMFAVKR